MLRAGCADSGAVLSKEMGSKPSLRSTVFTEHIALTLVVGMGKVRC